MKRTPTIVLCFLLLLLLVQTASAMSSPAYQIDWNNLLSGGGGPAASASYRVNFTVGQTASKTSASPMYQVQMGYWAGNLTRTTLYLPSIEKRP